MKAALVNSSTNVIENVITLPDDYNHTDPLQYQPPEGYIVVKDLEGKAIVGGTYRNGTWGTPIPPSVPTPIPSPQEQLDNLIKILIEKNLLNETHLDRIRKPQAPPGRP